MIECRVERSGFRLRGRSQAQDKTIIVPDEIFRIHGPAGSGHLSFIRTRGDRPVDPGDAIGATPAARAFANEHGIQIASVTGTGSGGQVTKADVVRHQDKPKPASPATGDDQDGDDQDGDDGEPPSEDDDVDGQG